MIDSASCKSELRRLESGPEKDEIQTGIWIGQFTVKCEGNAEDVLRTAVQTMEVICNECVKGWPDDADWHSLLPSRFVSACADEMTREQADQWMQRWQTLSQEQQELEERNRRWSLNNWLYWLKPSERQWQWWDAEVVNDNVVLVSVAVESWPFGWGALIWLFRGSGALEVVAEETTAD